jgi:hypothetical protein
MVKDMAILFMYKNYLAEWETISNKLLRSVDPATRNRRKKRMEAKKKLGGRQHGSTERIGRNNGGQRRANQRSGIRQRRRNPLPEQV